MSSTYTILCLLTISTILSPLIMFTLYIYPVKFYKNYKYKKNTGIYFSEKYKAKNPSIWKIFTDQLDCFTLTELHLTSKFFCKKTKEKENEGG